MKAIGFLVTLLMSFNVLAAECQSYQMSSGLDQATNTELVYDVSYPAGCESNPEIQQTLFRYDDTSDAQNFVLPVNRGLRCAPPKKYRNGACCTPQEDGSYKCPPKKCKPYNGPGCKRSNDSI